MLQTNRHLFNMNEKIKNTAYFLYHKVTQSVFTKEHKGLLTCLYLKIQKLNKDCCSEL